MYLVHTQMHTGHIHYGYTGAPGVWAGFIYTPYADRGLTRLYCVYTERLIDTQLEEPYF